MTSKRIGLTDPKVKQAKPREKPYNLYDTGGLYLTVSPTGAKWWRLKYRYAGRERRMGLGAYSEVSIAEARGKRDDARALLRQERDPGVIRRTARIERQLAAANNFEAIAREWLDVKAGSWVASQQIKERRRLEKHAFPWIGSKAIKEIRKADIKLLLERLVKRGTVDMAHRLRQQLSAIFAYAGRDDRMDGDPAAALVGTLPEHVQRNYSTLTHPDDVGELLRAIDGFKGQFPTACALRLAPMLFVRPGELRGARWAEFDIGRQEWRIPAVRRKLRKRLKEDPLVPPHIVPLSTQAIAILVELHPLTGHREHLFPGARDPKQSISNATLNAALRRLGYDKESMTGHGFRHMASTRLHELGWQSDIIERQLAHKGVGIRAVYNKAEHISERRTMMQAWSDYLDKLRAGSK